MFDEIRKRVRAYRAEQSLDLSDRAVNQISLALTMHFEALVPLSLKTFTDAKHASATLRKLEKAIHNLEAAWSDAWANEVIRSRIIDQSRSADPWAPQAEFKARCDLQNLHELKQWIDGVDRERLTRSGPKGKPRELSRHLVSELFIVLRHEIPKKQGASWAFEISDVIAELLGCFDMKYEIGTVQNLLRESGHELLPLH